MRLIHTHIRAVIIYEGGGEVSRLLIKCHKKKRERKVFHSALLAHPPANDDDDEQKKVNEKISSNNPIQKNDLRYMTYYCAERKMNIF